MSLAGFSPSTFAILYGKVKKLQQYAVTGLKYTGSISSLTQSPTSTNKGDLYISNVEGTLSNFGNISVKKGDGLIYNGSGWDKIPYSELSGGNDIISLTSNVAVGAIPAGTVVNNTSAELWRMALVKNLGLLVTLTGTLDKNIIYEKGVAKDTNLSVKVSQRDGSGEIASISYSSIPVHSSFNGSKTASNNTLYTDTVTITGLKDTQEFKVTAVDTNGTTSNATIKYEFVYPMYNILADWDSINNTRPVVDESMIVGGTKLVAKKATQTFTLNSAGTFKVPVFAYPKEYGSLTKILDVRNGFDLISNYTKGEINITCADGQVVPYVYYIANIYSKFNDFKISFQF